MRAIHGFQHFSSKDMPVKKKIGFAGLQTKNPAPHNSEVTVNQLGLNVQDSTSAYGALSRKGLDSPDSLNPALLTDH